MSRGRIALGVVAALLVAACGNSDSDRPPLTDPTTAPTVGSTATTPATTTSVVETTTSSTAAATTATTEPAEQTVGTVEAFEAQVDEVYDRLGTFATPRDEVPLPDATNADPLVAFQDLIEFHFWMMSTNPWRDWVELYALDSTTYASEQRNLTNAYSSTTGIYVFEDEPFTFRSAAEISLTAVSVPLPDRELLVDGSVALEFMTSSGDFRGAFSDTGELIEEIAGWSNLTSHAVLVPTEGGWRIAYIEWRP